MSKIVRHFARKKAINDTELRRLWPTHMTDCAIAKKLGHSKGALRRRAVKLGLPSSRRKLWEAMR